MRAGAEYFLEPGAPAQRRYEALRCYFVEQASAVEVGSRFGYSPATVHQLAAELRSGRTEFFRSAKPPYSSTPAYPNSTYPSPGGADDDYASASHPAKASAASAPQNLKRIIAPRIEANSNRDACETERRRSRDRQR